jgi:hypothetical protein
MSKSGLVNTHKASPSIDSVGGRRCEAVSHSSTALRERAGAMEYAGGMQIRHATPHDVEALVEVKRPQSDEQWCVLERRQRERFAAVSAGQAIYLVAEHGNDIHGHVVLALGGTLTAPGYPSMGDLYVRDDCRNQGVGRHQTLGFHGVLFGFADLARNGRI